MTFDKDIAVTGIVAIVGGVVMVSHILTDRARFNDMRRQSTKFEALRAEVRQFIDEAREKLK